jgi:GntP family gluconate:H+ symporter
MPASHPVLLVATALAIVALVALIARARWHPFVALAVVSLALGFAVGVRPAEVVRAFQEGLGATLASTAGVIALGAMMGRLLSLSGGAEALTARIVSLTGTARAPWAFAGAGLVIGLPVFFSVGFVLLMPLAYAAAASTGVPLLVLAMPLAAGLSAAHGLTPPHPGPLAALERLHADPGLVILYGVVAAIPAAIVAGPLLVRWAARRVTLPQAMAPGGVVVARGPSRVAPGALAPGSTPAPPGVTVTLVTLLLPVILMLGATASTLWLPPDLALATWLGALGQPLVAMLIAVLASVVVFGLRRGLGAKDLLSACEESLAPIAGILLVVGAGGGFGRVLDAAGVDDAIVGVARGWPLSPIVLGWVAAVLLRVSVGSATVAITTAASLVAPIVDATPGTNRELLVVAMGAGSLALSHVNDAGFWLVKEYFNASVGETLATWTVLETVIAVVGLAAVLLLDLWV